MRDEWFIRGSVPMTKAEVRAISISKLELKKDSILYDIGAGTGSVSIEAALQMPEGCVYAVEKNREAIRLIEKNRQRFHADNVAVIYGKAPEILQDLPVPTHVFLGGSGGNGEAVIKEVFKRNPLVRIVANVISLESLGQVLGTIKSLAVLAEVVSVQVAKAEQAGNYHLMKAQNPIYVITMGGT